MCGIIYVETDDPKKTRQLVELQFQAQITRGQSGFGILECTSGTLNKYLTTDEFLANLAKTNDKRILAHHRIPTSTKNTLESAHPFKVTCAKKEMFIVHNGIISNPDEVLDKLGVKKETLASYSKDKRYNDSEAWALDFISLIENKKSTPYSCGGIASVGVDVKNQALYFYHNSNNPLDVYAKEDILIIASEAIGGIGLEKDTLFKYEFEKKKVIKVRDIKVNYDFPKSTYNCEEGRVRGNHKDKKKDKKSGTDYLSDEELRKKIYMDRKGYNRVKFAMIPCVLEDDDFKNQMNCNHLYCYRVYHHLGADYGIGSRKSTESCLCNACLYSEDTGHTYDDTCLLNSKCQLELPKGKKIDIGFKTDSSNSLGYDYDIIENTWDWEVKEYALSRDDIKTDKDYSHLIQRIADLEDALNMFPPVLTYTLEFDLKEKMEGRFLLLTGLRKEVANTFEGVYAK